MRSIQDCRNLAQQLTSKVSNLPQAGGSGASIETCTVSIYSPIAYTAYVSVLLDGQIVCQELSIGYRKTVVIENVVRRTVLKGGIGWSATVEGDGEICYSEMDDNNNYMRTWHVLVNGDCSIVVSEDLP